MKARPWGKHRHWHDERGATHKQDIGHGWPLEMALRAEGPRGDLIREVFGAIQAACEATTYPCDACKAPIPKGEPVCPECGTEQLPF